MRGVRRGTVRGAIQGVAVRPVGGDDAGGVGVDPRRESSPSPKPLWAGLFLAAIPFTVLTARVLVARYFAMSDLALIEMRVRDVGGRHTPLVGVYSRYGWNHPGPLLFYALAVPYRLFGATGASLLGAGTMLNFAAVLGCVWLFWRRGGIAGLALGGLVLFVVLHALAYEALSYPWNPFAIVVPMFLLVLVVWSVTCGDDWMLPIAVALASFCAQAHVGSAGAAGLLVAIAVAAFVLHIRRGAAARAPRTALITAIVGVVLWIPPVIDQLRPRGGNLSALWRYWTGTHDHVTGWARGARIIASELAAPAPWMTTHEHTAAFAGGLSPRWQFPWALLLVLAAGTIAFRRRDRPSFNLVAIAVAFATAAWVSVARIVDEPYSYLLRWTWLVGAIAWLAIAWTVMRAVVDAPPLVRFARPAISIVGGAAIIMMIATTITGLRADLPDLRAERALQHLDPALIRAARRAPTPILIEGAPDLTSQELADGALLRLNRQGIPARFDEATGARGVGQSHTIMRRNARTTIVAAADDAIDDYLANPAYQLLASYDALKPEERQFVDQINNQMTHDLGPGRDLLEVQLWGRQHAHEWTLFNELNARGIRAALFIAVSNP